MSPSLSLSFPVFRFSFPVLVPDDLARACDSVIALERRTPEIPRPKTRLGWVCLGCSNGEIAPDKRGIGERGAILSPSRVIFLDVRFRYVSFSLRRQGFSLAWACSELGVA